MKVGEHVKIISGSAYQGQSGTIEHIDEEIVLQIGIGEVRILLDDGSNLIIPNIKELVLEKI